METEFVKRTQNRARNFNSSSQTVGSGRSRTERVKVHIVGNNTVYSLNGEARESHHPTLYKLAHNGSPPNGFYVGNIVLGDVNKSSAGVFCLLLLGIML